jgi:phosphatidylglycerophosphatase A
MDLSRPRENGDGGDVSFLTRLIATGFYSGYAPWASGTFGSLVGLALFLIPGIATPLPFALLIVAGFAVGVSTSGKMAAVEGHRLTKSAATTKAIFQAGVHSVPDPSIVVIDEIVGMWVALFLLPKSLLAVSLTFLLFRIFDVVKPPPARQVERLPNGWGIMLDDLVAGVFANIVTHIIILFL